MLLLEMKKKVKKNIAVKRFLQRNSISKCCSPVKRFVIHGVTKE